MAGGKETPRQKMIGMMYLVLTALLALQVSNSILDKFISIDQSLAIQNKVSDAKNGKTLSSISKNVEERGSQPKEVTVLNKAKEVRSLTNEVIDYVSGIKKDITGELDENGQVQGKKSEDGVENLMLAKKKGEELKQKLNEYAQKLSQVSGVDIEPLAKDPSEIDYLKNDRDQKNKSFAEFNFMKTPKVAAMATLTEMMSEVRRAETDALEKLAEEVGAKDISFDQIVPLVRPNSNTVAAGAKFEAQLFITASSSGTTPKFMRDGSALPVGATPQGISYGKVEFTATPGAYDPQTLMAKKSFKAQIALKDTTYNINHEYFVVKPVIQVRSAALSALYLNCGNELNIQVPALGTNYNPSFSSNDATVIKGSKKGLVTVIPSGRSKVKISVSSGGSALGSETFSVKKVPLPSYSFKLRGKEVDFKSGVKATAMRSLTVKAIADENFAREVPKDAKYRVREMNVTLARGTRPVVNQRFTSESLNLSKFATQARPGDRIVIEIKKVTRKTYQKKNERVATRNEIYTIPLN